MTYLYNRNTIPDETAQLLRVWIEDRSYLFSIIHAAWEVHYPSKHARSLAQQHAHNVYHIVLYTEGESLFLLNNKIHPAKPGVLAVVSPGEMHCFPPCGPNPVKYTEVTFELICGEERLTLPFNELLSAYAGQQAPDVAYPQYLESVSFHQMESLLQTLHDTLANPNPLRDFSANVIVAQILSFLAHNLYSDAGSDYYPAVSGLLRARTEIENKFREDLSIEYLANIAGLSTGYFIRAFRGRFGLPPIRYQQQLRINLAKNLLVTTGLACGEIAQRVGIDDQYYFSRMFRRFVGQTPLEYRHSRRLIQPAKVFQAY